MSMTAAGMGSALAAQLDADFGAVTGDEEVYREQLCLSLATAIVGYIQSNADVTVPQDSFTDDNGDDGPTSTTVLSGAIS